MFQHQANESITAEQLPENLLEKFFPFRVRGEGASAIYFNGETFLWFISLQLCGCGLLGVGIWLSVSQGNFATFSPSFPSLSAANLVIAIGTVIMVTGFLGCLGAIKENKCLLLSVRCQYFFSLRPVIVALLLFYLNDQCKIVLWITVTLLLAFNLLYVCSMTSHTFVHSDIIGVLANESMLLCALMH